MFYTCYSGDDDEFVDANQFEINEMSQPDLREPMRVASRTIGLKSISTL